MLSKVRPSNDISIYAKTKMLRVKKNVKSSEQEKVDEKDFELMDIGAGGLGTSKIK